MSKKQNVFTYSFGGDEACFGFPDRDGHQIAVCLTKTQAAGLCEDLLEFLRDSTYGEDVRINNKQLQHLFNTVSGLIKASGTKATK